MIGHRETEHLKTLYGNMKQQARRNDGECFANGTTKLLLFQKNEFLRNTTDEEEIKTLHNVGEEKTQNDSADIYKSRRLEPEQVEGQVQPLVDPYDSAAVYFRDNIDIPCDSAPDPVQYLDVSLSDMESSTKNNNCCQMPEPSSWEPPAAEKTDTVPAQRRKKPLSLEALKRLYFKRKCQNANLERKRIQQEISYAQEKHNLEMVILRKTLDKTT